MGWLETVRPTGVSLEEFFQNEWDPTCERSEIIASGSRGFTEFYAAIKDHVIGDVTAVAVHIRHVRDDRYNIRYKDVTEDSVPTIVRCPEKVLDALSPTDDDGANKWRKRCREWNARQKLARSLEDGELVRFDHPIRFRDGQALSTLRLIRVHYGQRDPDGRKIRFTPPRSDYPIYQITGWKDREFVRVSEEAQQDGG